MKPAAFAAPAKLNLFLAITGRRPDGFHDLVSVVAPVEYADTLHAEPAESYSLTCEEPGVPVDGTNLILKAAQAFSVVNPGGGVRFRLEKRIPMGAGLGGGSSDGVAALRALNTFTRHPLPASALTALASGLGSDCALFLHGGPVVMRGRGERIEALPPSATARLRGRRVLIFKPEFGIATPWAYGAMAARPTTYLPADAAEAQLAAWLADDRAPAERLLFNNMEQVACDKFVALPALLNQLRADFSLEPRMSGSGSACFVFLAAGSPVAEITRTIRAAWGATAFVVETRIA